MFKITVPASSANLGSGFDTFGLALTLYNVFEFEKSEEFYVSGFDADFELDRNLVFSSYKTVFETLKKEIIPVSISLKKSDIPISRGLGSSCSCIIAGVLAANLLLGNPLTQEECLNLMAHIEGHPDNVSASFYGGLTSSLKVKDKVVVSKWVPSENLSFYALIPSFPLPTSISRRALPRVLPVEDIVYTLSRASQLGSSFTEGNLELIKEAVKDKIHEPYRYPLIEDGLIIKEKVNSLGGVVTISGSGPTLLVTSNQDLLEELTQTLLILNKWRIVELHVDNNGTQLIEE